MESIFSKFNLLNVGYCIMLTVYFSGGIVNLIKWQDAKSFVESRNIKLSSSAVVMISACWQIVSVILLVLPGYRTYGALSLVVFTLTANFLFHSFWQMKGMERYLNQIFFLANLGSIGGIVLLLDALGERLILLTSP